MENLLPRYESDSENSKTSGNWELRNWRSWISSVDTRKVISANGKELDKKSGIIAAEIIKLQLRTKGEMSQFLLHGKRASFSYPSSMGKDIHTSKGKSLIELLKERDPQSVTFLMPGNDIIKVNSRSTTGVQNEPILIGPAEDYDTDRVAYFWAFLGFMEIGINCGSTISKLSSPVKGIEWEFDAISDAVRCYSSVYTVGTYDGFSNVRWKVEKANLLTKEPEDISEDEWDSEKGKMLLKLGAIFLGERSSTRDHYENIDNAQSLKYPPFLRESVGIKPDESVFAHGSAVYRRKYMASAAFYLAFSALLLASVVIGAKQDLDFWGKAETVLNNLLTGAVAIVLSLAGLSEEGDYKILNLIFWRAKLDNIGNKSAAESIVKAISPDVGRIGKYIDGSGASWCADDGGTTTLLTPISSEVFGPSAITLMSGYAFVTIKGNKHREEQYLRVTNVNEKVWHLVPTDDQDVKAIKYVAKVRLEHMAHDIGKIEQ